MLLAVKDDGRTTTGKSDSRLGMGIKESGPQLLQVEIIINGHPVHELHVLGVQVVQKSRCRAFGCKNGAALLVPSLENGGFGVAVTGPRRNMMRRSNLHPYFVVPFGDMMLTGCFGLLAATGDVLPSLKEQILASLHGGGGSGTPPWELS